MTAGPHITGIRLNELPFTDDDFRVIAHLARRSFGLSLQETKKPLIYSRLARRIRALRLGSFRAYCALLESPAGAEEQLTLLSALTTNVTQFFRERHHFDLLRETVLPPLIERARAGGRVRLWSAGCSSGEEPYSLAMTILDLCPGADRLDLKVLATDIDPVILDRARRGAYLLPEIEGIPPGFRETFLKAVPHDDGLVEIVAPARGLVAFGLINLIGDWPVRGPFDVIVCRNVAIYFDKPTQARLWQRFGGLLAPGGHLIIGHSERVAGPATAVFKSAGITAYRKLGAVAPPPRPALQTARETGELQ